MKPMEDLLAEPSNIVFTTHIAKDVVRYEVIEAFRKGCVTALRQKLIREPTCGSPSLPVS
jgi:hypothetical protein